MPTSEAIAPTGRSGRSPSPIMWKRRWSAHGASSETTFVTSEPTEWLSLDVLDERFPVSGRALMSQWLERFGGKEEGDTRSVVS